MALSDAVGHGFSTNDIPALKRMLESGELRFENWKFVFAVQGSASNVTGGACATNITPEMIDLRRYFPNPAANTSADSVRRGAPKQAPLRERAKSEDSH